MNMKPKVGLFFLLLEYRTDHTVLVVASQINELNIIRQSLYDLKSQHGKIRQP
jgi:Tup N-terminal